MITRLETKPKVETIVVERTPPLDLIIIGGGPSGMTAALFALRSRLKTLLIEKAILGGQASTTFAIENYPGIPGTISGLKLAQQMEEQIKTLGLEILWGSAAGLKNKSGLYQVEVDGKIMAAKAIIVASGTEAKKIGCPGEDKLRGRGVSYCATCDGPFYRDKNIVVVGGGNSAVEEALFLTRYARKVSLVHRRDVLRADKILAEEAKSHPKIYFFWHSVVEEISGKGRVEEVTLKDLLTNKKLKVPVDGVFIYVGSMPNSAFVKDLVKLDDYGFIVTDEEMKTSAPGIFAAGDIRVKTLRQVITAAADGAIAANSAREYIDKLGKGTIL